PTVIGPAIVKARERLSNVAVLDELLARSERVAEPLRRIVERSGSTLTPGAVLLAVLFIAITAGVTVFSLSQSILVSVVVAVLVANAPLSFLRWKGRKRLALFEEQ